MTNSKIKDSKDQEIALLKAKLAELERNISSNDKVTIEEDDDYEKKVQPDDYVSVMSLLPYNLNLSTQEGGQGSVKKFTKFGEVKRILYRDLVEILEVHRNFVEAGYFYIMNPQLIRYHGLDDVYEKILNKESIEEIISTSSEHAVDLYSTANNKQQEIIIQLLVNKIKDNPDSLNLNIIDKISRISKVDIFKKAEELRESESVEDNKD